MAAEAEEEKEEEPAAAFKMPEMPKVIEHMPLCRAVLCCAMHDTLYCACRTYCILAQLTHKRRGEEVF